VRTRCPIDQAPDHMTRSAALSYTHLLRELEPVLRPRLVIVQPAADATPAQPDDAARPTLRLVTSAAPAR
jgi:hypothetical protein